MPTFQIPGGTVPSGEFVAVNRNIPQKWGAAQASFDIANAIFPLWVRVEYSNDNGSTWHMMMNFDVTGLGHDKLGNLVTDCTFSVVFPDQFFSGGTRARIVITSPSSWTSVGGTVTVT